MNDSDTKDLVKRVEELEEWVKLEKERRAMKNIAEEGPHIYCVVEELKMNLEKRLDDLEKRQEGLVT